METEQLTAEMNRKLAEVWERMSARLSMAADEEDLSVYEEELERILRE